MSSVTTRILGSIAIAAALASGLGCGSDGAHRYDPSRQPVGASGVCAQNGTVEGIDVSSMQGNIDWRSVALSGHSFAFARVSDGIFEDPMFATHWQGIRAAGLIRGAYQSFRPGLNAAAQADLVVRAVGRLGAGDLPVTLQIDSADGTSPADLATAIRVWADWVEVGTGRTPMILTTARYWNEQVGSLAFGTLPLWIAAYGTQCPSMPNGWSQWTFFQSADHGEVPGVEVTNLGIDRFDGTVEQLRTLAGFPLPATVPLAVDWRRESDGTYAFATQAPASVMHVVYVLDGVLIGDAPRTVVSDFSIRAALPNGPGRMLTVLGLDANERAIVTAHGMLDVGEGTGISIRPTGVHQWEIRMDQAPWDVASIEVDVDGSTLIDIDSSSRQSPRRAVRSMIDLTGRRAFDIATYTTMGAPHGMVRRMFDLD